MSCLDGAAEDNLKLNISENVPAGGGGGNKNADRNDSLMFFTNNARNRITNKFSDSHDKTLNENYFLKNKIDNMKIANYLSTNELSNGGGGGSMMANHAKIGPVHSHPGIIEPQRKLLPLKRVPILQASSEL